MIKVYILENPEIKNWKKVLTSMHNNFIIKKIPEKFDKNIWINRGVKFIKSESEITEKVPVFNWTKTIQNESYYTASHPDNLGAWNFGYFNVVDVNWELETEYFIYVDGSYGRKYKTSGYSVILCTEYDPDPQAISHNNMKYKVIEFGKTPVYGINLKDYSIDENISVPATNNRAEGYAMIRALILARTLKGIVTIVSDSELWCNIITKWMNYWMKNRIVKKNPDMVNAVYKLYKSDINILHQNSHKENQTQHGFGNDMADKYAVKGAAN